MLDRRRFCFATVSTSPGPRAHSALTLGMASFHNGAHGGFRIHRNSCMLLSDNYIVDTATTCCGSLQEVEMANEQYKALEQSKTVLEKIFEAGTGLCEDRGFKRRVGYGTQPSFTSIWPTLGPAGSLLLLRTWIPSSCLPRPQRRSIVKVSQSFSLPPYDVLDDNLASIWAYGAKVPLETLDAPPVLQISTHESHH